MSISPPLEHPAVAPWNFARRPWVCVVAIRSGEERYLGISCQGAARALVRGTCFATGINQGHARRLAAEQREWFLRGFQA